MPTEPVEISLPSDPLTLGAIVTALDVAFQHALKTLAEHHGNAAGNWLDALEQRTLATIKSTEATNASFEHEAVAMRAAVGFVSAVFAEARAALRHDKPI